MKVFDKDNETCLGLSDVQLEEIGRWAVSKLFRRGEVLLCEGDSTNGIFIIKSGYVKVFQHNENGREQILAILSRGDIIGEMGAYGGKLRSASVTALESTETILIPQYRFKEILVSIPAISLKITEIVMERLKQANKQLVQFAGCSSREKVIYQLLTLAKQHGSKKQNGILIAPRLTHSDIASLSGVVRETVTKILNELKKEGLIAFEGRRVLISDIQSLQRTVEIAEIASFSGKTTGD